jgi:excisionase family DNA binding protein
MGKIAPAALSREDAAAYIGVSTDSLDRSRARGEITAFTVGRLVRYKLAELDAYMDRATLCQDTNSSSSAIRRTFTSNGSKTDTRAASQRGLEAVRRLRRSSQLSG